jgi:hypothetical protein
MHDSHIDDGRGRRVTRARSRKEYNTIYSFDIVNSVSGSVSGNKLILHDETKSN